MREDINRASRTILLACTRARFHWACARQAEAKKRSLERGYLTRIPLLIVHDILVRDFARKLNMLQSCGALGVDHRYTWKHHVGNLLDILVLE